MNWLKIILFVLSAAIAIGGLHLTKPERPSLAKILILLIIITTIIGIVLEIEDVREHRRQQSKAEEAYRKIDEQHSAIMEKDKKIAQLEQSQKEIEKLAQPRTLSREQKTRLLQLLSVKSNFQIILVCRLMDQESANYAEEIAEVFRQSGWAVGPTNKSFLDNIESDAAVAVTNDSQRETANNIAMILNSVGIKCGPEQIRENSISGVQPDTIYLIIGSKIKQR